MYTLVCGAGLADVFVPNSYWFEVGPVHVDDSEPGVSPKMVVARKINRSFYGNWSVAVKQAANVLEPNLYYSTCTAVGEAYYQPSSVLPPPSKLNLNWWTFPRECYLDSGAYIVETAWTFPGFFRNRTVVNRSNVFIIK